MTSPAIAWREDQREAYEREQLRLAYERGPLPKNDPALFTPTRCRVLKPFGLAGGGVARVDSTVELPRHDALSLAAIGKVQILEA